MDRQDHWGPRVAGALLDQQGLEGHLDSKEIPDHRVPWEPQVKVDLQGLRAQWDTLDTTGLTAFRGTMDLPATMAPEVLQVSRVHRGPWDLAGTMDRRAHLGPPQVTFLRDPLVLRGRLGPQEQGTLHGACTRKREKYSKHRETWPTR